MRLEKLRARLEPANVAKLLARGFALVLDLNGHVVARSGALSPAALIRIALGDGWLDARVLGLDEGQDPLPGRATEVSAERPEGGSGGEGSNGGDSGGGQTLIPSRGAYK
jgi:exodeoxyribonuclease VII large subunit